MSRYIVSLSPSQSRTRILLLDGKDEIMRAVLPSGASCPPRWRRGRCTRRPDERSTARSGETSSPVRVFTSPLA
jgi:hypothetical protein